MGLCLVFALGLTFMIIAPSMMLACFVYFFFATLVYAWLFAYVYSEEFDGRGVLWLCIFNNIMAGKMFGTLVLFALVKNMGDTIVVRRGSPIPSSEYISMLGLLLVEL